MTLTKEQRESRNAKQLRRLDTRDAFRSRFGDKGPAAKRMSEWIRTRTYLAMPRDGRTYRPSGD